LHLFLKYFTLQKRLLALSQLYDLITEKIATKQVDFCGERLIKWHTLANNCECFIFLLSDWKSDWKAVSTATGFPAQPQSMRIDRLINATAGMEKPSSEFQSFRGSRFRGCQLPIARDQ